MKKIVLFGVIIIFLAQYKSLPQNFWEKTDGPYGGQINSISANSSNKIVVGTKNGIFASIDTCENWETFLPSFKNKYIQNIKYFNHNFFAAVDYNSVLRMSEDGIIVDTIYYSLQERPWSLEISKNGKIFIGINDNILSSTDQGQNWEIITDSTFSLYFPRNIIAANDSIIFFTGNGNIIYRSINGGKSWNLINQSFQNSSIISFYLDENDYLYATTDFRKIYESIDYGETWVSIDNGYFDNFLVNLNTTLKKNNDIYIGTTGGVFKTSDHGNSWYQYSIGLFDDYITLLYLAQNKIIAGTPWAGIYTLNENNNQ